MRFLFIYLCLIPIAWCVEHQAEQNAFSTLYINEFLASNQGGLTDGYGNSSDWIELYNAGDSSISLTGWALTDDAKDLRKWVFPEGTRLEAHTYLVIFASKASADETIDPQGFLHANFKLSRSGEYLALVNPDGVVVHDFGFIYPPQESQISYGLDQMHPSYFGKPTPGGQNVDPFPGFIPSVQVSHQHGFYDQAFELYITCDSPDAILRYTLDGSEPDETSGLLYQRDQAIPITTTTVLRTQAYPASRSELRIRPVVTHTYLFLDDVIRQPKDPIGWPTNWGYSSDAKAVVPADYEMDPRVVEQTLPGYSARDALLAIPTVSVVMKQADFISDETGIYANPLSRWERFCSVEYILPPGHPDWKKGEGFQVPCKIEVHGNASRRPYRMQKHSLRLTFSGEVGPSKLRYPLFADTDVEAFNQLVLRACFTDSWGLVSWGSSRYRPNDSQYLRDVWMKNSLRAMGQPSSHGNFVHLYVNGLYFGLHNLTERVKEEFFASYLGGEPEDWEVNVDLAHPGPRWRAMMSIDPSTMEGYQEIQDYVDVENFADYMLLHFFADAEDWPHHNGYAAANPVSGDGQFRFWVWDQEIVLDYHGRAAQRIDNNRGAGALFQKLRTNPDFRLLFADRFYKHCFQEGALSLQATQTRYQALADVIDQAIVAESARWGDTQMSTPYGSKIEQPNPLTHVDHIHYPPAPHGPDYYFTREDSWIVERDNILNNYLPAIYDTNNKHALIHLLRVKDLYPPIEPPQMRINGAPQPGGSISRGTPLEFVNPNDQGQIYYTLDGSDPRVPGGGDEMSKEVLVSDDALKYVWAANRDIGEEWRIDQPRGWIKGTGTVGYERQSGYQSWIDIDMEDRLYQQGTSCYVRIPFHFYETIVFDRLDLYVRYDDGFVAYLNGTEIARALVTGEPQWNSAASGSHEASEWELFDITAQAELLNGGENSLALQGLNVSASSSDFIISAELVASTFPETDAMFSPGAILYEAPISVDDDVTIKARCLHGQTWSALAEAQLVVD